MERIEYPVDVRADYPERSSRLWAVLTIFWIKFLALIPHGIILIFLGIAQWVVAFVAQFAVAINGEYPAGMHEFVTGVLRWQTRVTAFILSVDDRYPPFSLQRIDDYPVDVVTERPTEPSRTYAIFTIIVQVLAIAGGIWFAVWLIGHADTFASTSAQNGNYSFRSSFPSFGGSGLALRQLAAIPHYIVLAFVGIAALVLWVVAQWVILFVAILPARHVGHRGGLRALVHARERLRPGARRPVPAVLDEPVAVGRRAGRGVVDAAAASTADDGDVAASAGASGSSAAGPPDARRAATLAACDAPHGAVAAVTPPPPEAPPQP